MSKKEHEIGSDRFAEALEEVNPDLIVDVQGDEPFQEAKALQDLVTALQTLR
jgi:3-deoxy-manno-octulosonate cytidylyltransferase (CMP-KDO synthetase)